MKSVFNFAAVSAFAMSLALGGMVATSDAAAAPGKFFPKPFKKALKESVVSKPKNKSTDCVDLSGEWVGQCTDSDGETYDEKLSIDQYRCESIELDGTSMDIGGAKTLTDSDSEGNWSNSIYPQWSTSRMALKAKFTMSGRGYNEESFWLGRGTVDFVPFEDRLISRSTFDYEFEYSGRISVGRSWTECTYSKQK